MPVSKKAPLWNPAQEQAIESEFDTNGRIDNERVKEILKADATIETPIFGGKTVNMLRAKIVKEGYYNKAEPKAAASTGATTTRKLDLVKTLEILMGVTDLSSFEKASKPQLEKAVQALTQLSDIHNAENVSEDS